MTALLERDNLFQLNVLIWASLELPTSFPIIPVLFNAGHTLYTIEQRLVASPIERARLIGSQPPINQNPVADGILHNESKGLFTLIECKPDSFGVDSSNCDQARGLIVAASNIGQRIGQPATMVGEVCYIVPADTVEAMEGTLTLLADDVAARSLPTCPTGSLGISIADDGIYLIPSESPHGGAVAPNAVDGQLMVPSEPNQDPAPLYVIPWIPKCESDAPLRAFKEKIRAQLLMWLGRSSAPSNIQLEFQALLSSISLGVFDRWEDKTSLHNEVFPQIRSIVHSLVNNDGRVEVLNRSVHAALHRDDDRETLLEIVRTSKVPDRLPEGIQELLL